MGTVGVTMMMRPSRMNPPLGSRHACFYDPFWDFLESRVHSVSLFERFCTTMMLCILYICQYITNFLLDLLNFPKYLDLPPTRGGTSRTCLRCSEARMEWNVKDRVVWGVCTKKKTQSQWHPLVVIKLSSLLNHLICNCTLHSLSWSSCHSMSCNLPLELVILDGGLESEQQTKHLL